MHVYRVADYDSPLWVNPPRHAGRFHRSGQDPTQYWSTHPAGAWAEAARATGARTVEDLRLERRRLWVGRVDPERLADVDFSSAGTVGLTAKDLVSGDWAACQDAADRLRAERRAGLVAPSAALPGTSSVVLFGPRVAVPLAGDAIDNDLDFPVALAAADGHAPEAILPLVRWRGEVHEGLRAFERGQPPPRLPVLAD